MPDIEFLKTWTPQAYGIWSLVALMVANFAREYRENRKLSSSDRMAKREGFEKLVEGLRKENRDLSGDLASLRREYDAYRKLCHEETDQLRAGMRLLEDTVEGLKRQVAAQGSASVRLVRDAHDRQPPI